MAILPTRLVEVEFDAGVWTDVSADVVAISTRRGRNKESGAFEAGTMRVTLRNDGRKYDPDNAAGPYYGKLRPNRRIRFRATYNAITYPVYQGYIDRITQQWSGPNDATASIEATDLFKLLSRSELAVSAYAAEVAADSPLAFYRLDEPNDQDVAFDSSGNNRDAAYLGGPIRQSAGLIVRDPGHSTQFVNGDDNRVEYAGNLITAFPFTIEAVISVPASNTAFRIIYDNEQNSLPLNNAHYFAVDDNAAGRPGTLTWVASSPLRQVYTTARVDDGSPHHVAIVATSGTDTRLYVDGVESTNVAFAGTAAFTAGTYRTGIGNTPAFSSTINSLALSGYLQGLAVYGTALSAARIAAHSAATKTPWNGELPGTRLGRVLDAAAVPSADRTLDAGTTTLQATSLGTDPLSYAQKVEETEAGRLFVTRDGKVRFIGRQAGDTGTYLTSLATLVDDDSGAGLPYLTASADLDEALIVTRATVSRDGSVAITYFDAAAKAEFGWIDQTHEGLLHDSDTYSRAYAEWIVNTHKTPASRVGTVTLELAKDPVNLYPGILVLELADRLTWKRKPQNTGAVISQAMRLEAIAHETGGHYWRTSLLLTPFNLGASGYGTGVWDTSLWDQAVWGL